MTALLREARARFGIPLVFVAIIMRSNWYMSRYMRILYHTARPEYNVGFAPRYLPSAATVVHAAHGFVAVGWLLALVVVCLKMYSP